MGFYPESLPQNHAGSPGLTNKVYNSVNWASTIQDQRYPMWMGVDSLDTFQMNGNGTYPMPLESGMLLGMPPDSLGCLHHANGSYPQHLVCGMNHDLSVLHMANFTGMQAIHSPRPTNKLIQPANPPSSHTTSLAMSVQGAMQGHRNHCPWPAGCNESFTRLSDLERHWQSVHLEIKYHCYWIGCHDNHGKGYCRLEKLKAHQKDKHGATLV
jgi:hypothetical protein